MKRILGGRRANKSSEDGKGNREPRNSEEHLVWSPSECVELGGEEKAPQVLVNFVYSKEWL